MSEEIRDAISHLTGKTFEITDSGRYPIPKEHVKWFMWCPEITEMMGIPYVNVVWSDKNDNIYLDSMPIGDTTAWIEEEYGEKGVHRVLSMELQDFKSPAIRSKFGEEFPSVQSLVSAYERIARDISTESGVNLEIWYYGRKGIATGRLRSTIPTKNLDFESTLKQIETAVNALKKVLDRIREYDAKMAKSEMKERSRIATGSQ